ncbi:MAG: hypothetical protein IJS53_00685 [Clostridia bacterium]|nr:hypothetical protein [Clostridia bacterium]
MKRLQCFFALLAALLLLLPSAAFAGGTITVYAADWPVERGEWYDTLEEVAVYITLYHGLPGNYITKDQAAALGWSSSAGNLWRVAPGKSIGGDRFGNYEGLVPSKSGRTWKECDIGFEGGYRNGKRIVYSSDWLIYYTGDHYESFSEVKVITATPAPQRTPEPTPIVVDEYGLYTSKDEVALYLHEFWGLPANYITMEEAFSLGWNGWPDTLGEAAPGYAIGGDEFVDWDGLLPATETRTWYECDVNGEDGCRSDERLVYSSDGLIFYSADGFETFEQLY